MLLKICSKLLCLKEKKKIMRTYGTHLKEKKKNCYNYTKELISFSWYLRVMFKNAVACFES